MLVFSCGMFIFVTKTCCRFLKWFADLTKVAILKTKLLAGNDHVIDIFTSEDSIIEL